MVEYGVYTGFAVLLVIGALVGGALVDYLWVRFIRHGKGRK